MYQHIKVPTKGEKITVNADMSLTVPDMPIIPYIEGDGTGMDITPVMLKVVDAAVAKAYGGKREIQWMEVYAGEKSTNIYGPDVWLPAETLDAVRDYVVSIKGPLTTPVGGGIRSLNVALRQELDLYVCLRPVRYFAGVPSPLKEPEKTDNTSEDNGSVSKSVVDMERYLGMVNGLHNHDHDDEYPHSVGSNDDGNDSLTHFDCNALDQTTAAITTHSILSHHPNVHDDINGVAAASQQHRHADDDDELHDNHYLETTPYVTLEPPSFMPLPTTIQLCHSNDVANDDASGNSGSKSANSFVGTVGKSVMGIIHGGSSTTKSKTQFAGDKHDKHDNTIHRNTKNITSKTTSTAKSTAPKKELSLSISSVEGPTPSLEIVPTMDIPTVMPLWKENWTKERKEWEEREEKIRQERLLLVLNRQIDLKRSQTHGNTITSSSSSSRSGGGSGKGSGGGGGGICGLGSIIKVRRNHSEPVVSHLKSCNGQPPPPPSFHNAHSNHLHSQHGKHPHNNDRNNNHHHHHHRTKSITGSRGTTRSNENSKTRKYKYGMPPTIPSKFQKQPNPIVTTSSKKIGKKHARYALTAGMMLGIRESVGGALGVEHELEIGRWRELELEEGGDDGEGVDENGNVVVVVVDDGDGGGENVEGVVEKKELDDNLEDSNNSAGVDGSTKGNASQSSSQSTSTAKATPKTTSTAQTTSSQSPKRSSTSNTSTGTSTTDASTSNTNKSKTTSAYTTMLTQECARVSKYKFPPHQFYLGSNTRAGPLPHKYKFKVYAPLVFARIRSLFGVEKQTFLHSICGKFNFYEFASNARSGQVSCIAMEREMAVFISVTMGSYYLYHTNQLTHFTISMLFLITTTHYIIAVFLLQPRRPLYDQNTYPH